MNIAWARRNYKVNPSIVSRDIIRTKNDLPKEKVYNIRIWDQIYCKFMASDQQAYWHVTFGILEIPWYRANNLVYRVFVLYIVWKKCNGIAFVFTLLRDDTICYEQINNTLKVLHKLHRPFLADWSKFLTALEIIWDYFLSSPV